MGVLAYLIGPFLIEKFINGFVFILTTFSITWVYSIYVMIMTIIFEETTRFIVLYGIMKRNLNLFNVTLFGFGFGAIESFHTLGCDMSIYAFTSIIYNQGHLFDFFSKGDAIVQYNYLLTNLISSSIASYLISLFDMLMMIAIQVLITVIMYYCIKKEQYIKLIIPLLLHAVLTFLKTESSLIMPYWVGTIITLIILICLLLVLYIKTRKKDDFIQV